MKNVIPVTEARKQIFNLVEEVNTTGKPFLLTEKGRAKAVLMSADEFESWQETMGLIRDFPDLKKDIADAELSIKTGDYLKFTTLEEILAKEGFIVSDKFKKYEASTKIPSKSRERTK